ncbi:Swt1 family HEPN domain-containing protein [uncultured Enterovirga sp.]|uniref:Swt1 family HEPN domain-containing protein n=1 Tax=uncultured Enterovirga sp. TaxID=2026352 RepID=UPI0035CA7E9B
MPDAPARQVREFVFKGLLFDAECERFRAAGINIGVPVEASEHDLMREVLAPFSIALRGPALRMARLYATLYGFENSVRELIIARLLENRGVDWWNSCVPASVKKYAEARKISFEKNSWLEGAPAPLIHYVDFGHLADIIAQNWTVFEDLVPSQHWLKQRFEELEKARNFVAHNRNLLDNEFERIEMYVSDWSKQVGF